MTEQAVVQTRQKAPPAPAARGTLQRACACGQHTGSGGECAECKKKRLAAAPFGLQRAPLSRSGSDGEDAPPIVHEVLRSPGQPLDAETRNFMEPRFGHDFSRVRVHTGERAAASALAVNALAYTVGNHIAFGEGRYTPGTQSGKKLLAHELTHVAQQSSEGNFFQQSLVVGSAHDLHESEANHIADTVVNGSNVPSVKPRGIPGQLLHRTPDEPEVEVDCPEHPPNRAEEIQLSRTSPGGVAGVTGPLALSLYNFAIDSSTPKSEHIDILHELATLLNTYARGQIRAHLVGNTDCTGPTGYNVRLSERRARAVRDILTPLLSSRIGISWAGEVHPVASNATAEGRSRNRRVDVRFVSVAAPPPSPQVPTPDTPTPTPEQERPEEDQPERDRCPWYLPLLCAGPGLPWLLPLICLLEPALCVIPVLPPPTPPGPEEPEQQPQNPPRVTFVPDVRAPNTQPGMNDRISNASPVTIAAVVTNPPPEGQSILVRVNGVGLQAGNATIDNTQSIQITGTTAFQVQGSALTAPGSNAPRLQLGAWFGGNLVGVSNGFSVSAIMQDWETSLDAADEFPLGFSLYVLMRWASDGTSIRDLSECHYVELVGVAREEGAMRGMGTGRVQDPDDFALGDIMPNGDTHGTERQWLTGPGFQRLHQLWQMRDTRSNSDWVPSRNSGFYIDRTYERDSENPLCWQLTVEKVGGAVNIGGATADAGRGQARHVWHRINCEPPPSPQEEPQTGPTPEPEVQPPSRPSPEELPPLAPPACDQAELARRVDECIEEARQGAIDCTWGLVPFSGGWGGVGAGIEYYLCLRDVRERLLECDRQAKTDTHCLVVSLEDNLQRDFERCMDEEDIPVPAGAEAATQAHEEALERCYVRTGYRSPR